MGSQPSDTVLGVARARVAAVKVFAAEHPGQVILALDHRLVGEHLELLHDRVTKTTTRFDQPTSLKVSQGT